MYLRDCMYDVVAEQVLRTSELSILDVGVLVYCEGRRRVSLRSQPRSDPYRPTVGRGPVLPGCPASHLLLAHPGHTASDGSFYRDFAQHWRKDAGARRIQVGLRRNSRNERLDGRRWPGRIGIEVRIVGHSSEMGNRYEARSCIFPFFRFSSSLSLLLELPRFPGDLFVQHHAETRR